MADKPVAIIELLQEAGLSGIIAYAICFVCFYPSPAPPSNWPYHRQRTVVDPRILQDDGATGKAETPALLGSFYLACKPFRRPASAARSFHTGRQQLYRSPAGGRRRR